MTTLFGRSTTDPAVQKLEERKLALIGTLDALLKEVEKAAHSAMGEGHMNLVSHPEDFQVFLNPNASLKYLNFGDLNIAGKMYELVLYRTDFGEAAFGLWDFKFADSHEDPPACIILRPTRLVETFAPKGSDPAVANRQLDGVDSFVALLQELYPS